MTSASPNIQIFGLSLSQPCRAVLWLLEMENVPYDCIPASPLDGSMQTKEFVALSPTGTIPVIKDGEFSIGESVAIMGYLCDKYGWEKWYPKELKMRSQVDEYLHWHHRGARNATARAFWFLIKQVLVMKTETDAENFAKLPQVLNSFLPNIVRFLGNKKYIASENEPTIADIACYCELDQIELLNLFDFSEYPTVQQWLDRMKQLPGHDKVRVSLMEFKGKAQEMGLIA